MSDEDLTAILVHGDHWKYDTATGITRRNLYHSPSNSFDYVASMRSFKCGCVYITTLIVNELIKDNSVEESIVH